MRTPERGERGEATQGAEEPASPGLQRRPLGGDAAGGAGGESVCRGHRLGKPAGHQDGRVQLGRRGVVDLLHVVVRQEVPHQVVVHPEAAQQHVGGGNPHDLGMILVPGTYNGLQKYSFYPRIHFTGAVNSGMSGGPAVDANGQIVGVNVASAGNQLGFLVPAEALQRLLARFQQEGQSKDLRADIERQLLASQQSMFSQILNADWKLKDFGIGKVPDEVVPFVRCWGESNIEKDKEVLKKVTAFCSQI